MKNKISTIIMGIAIGVSTSTSALAQSNFYELPTANPQDVGTINNLLSALYETISGGAGEGRDWARFTSLWHPDANLIMVTPGADSGASQIFLTLESFIALSSAHSQTRAIYELECQRNTERIGHMAQVSSSYQIVESPDSKKVVITGVNLFQLYYDGSRWWIMNCIWENALGNFQLPDGFGCE
ncbi:MAG: nuclear transport factor 2 family protein [Bacteroidetes bacterium]|nr:nuclear transport factor 2 family protein [Bacteroidota bacterium]